MASGRGAVGALYDSHGPALFRYAAVMLADRTAAEDVVQETFVKLAGLLERRPSFVPSPEYVRAMLRNECYSALRHRRRHAERPTALLEPASPEASEEERLLLESALRALPPEQREVVYLKVFEGCTFDEIAAMTDVSINTAASRYRYAMGTLRRTLAPEAAVKDVK